MRLVSIIAVLTIAFALAPHAAARGAAGRGSQAEEKQAGGQQEAQGADSAVERSTAAEKSVVVSLCVSTGDVVVRGWDRAEVRARASDASSLRLLTPNVQPASSVEVLVSQRSDAGLPPGDCGTAGTLELSVPRRATANGEDARSADYDFKTISGDVTLELPADSSFRLHAKVVMSGDILTDFPVRTSAGSSSSLIRGAHP